MTSIVAEVRPIRSPSLSVSDGQKLKKLVKKCVNWPFTRDHDGYPLLVSGRLRIRLHRVFYELFIGPIPKGMHVLHRCDNPACIETSHYWLGTHLENIQDKVNKGRQPNGDTMAHAKLTHEKVRMIRASDLPVRKLAVMTGVSKSSVQQVRKGQTWKHVQ